MGPSTSCWINSWPNRILQQHCRRKHSRVQAAPDDQSNAPEQVESTLPMRFIAIDEQNQSKIFFELNISWYFRYKAAFLWFISCNAMLAAAAAALCAYFGPAAAGSGIPEVKAYLNGVDAPSILAPSTLFVKVCMILIETFNLSNSNLIITTPIFDVHWIMLVSFVLADCWVYIWGVCWVCAGQGRSYGAHWGLCCLLSRTRRVAQVWLHLELAQVLQE